MGGAGKKRAKQERERAAAERLRHSIIRGLEMSQVSMTEETQRKWSAILDIPVFATTQNAARLGPLCSELTLPPTAFEVDKTNFSMVVPSLKDALDDSPSAFKRIAIVGIESHICVTQTALDLMNMGHIVYILADGVGSCNAGEIGIALNRLASAGAVVTTSESWLYECMGDAGIPEFKAIAALVKETKASTRDAVQTLCKM
ncbi:MAG: hypothetical protein Q9181_001281 [Wetmoreana brouardii]